MFKKLIIFGLFEMILKKEKKKGRRVRTASPGPCSISESGRGRRRGPSQERVSNAINDCKSNQSKGVAKAAMVLSDVPKIMSGQ